MELTAKKLIQKLEENRSDSEVKKYSRYFKTGKGEYGEGDLFIGVRMGIVFSISKEFLEMPISQIEKLLENQIHEVRACGLSIMNQLSRKKRTPESKRKEMYELYLKRHDRINNWDLVDVAAPYVVGQYLFDKPRDVLYKLAKSKNIWERRTSIVSTAYFIRNKDLDDTFKISEMLLEDKEDLIHKASGWMLRYAGDMDKKRLLEFLDKYGATMPRTMLRYSIEKLSKEERIHYMNLKQKK